MGYHIRILGTQDPNISIDEITAGLEKGRLRPAPFMDENWPILLITNEQGDDLAQVERSPILDGRLGKAELEDFRKEIADGKPEAAAKWLDQYFDKIKVIYSFQILNSAFKGDNYSIISAVRNAIWNEIGGILQADGQGFSNEDGFHILWQFSDKATGGRRCAVLNGANEWVRFRMNLGDIGQRREFWEGKVPSGAPRL